MKNVVKLTPRNQAAIKEVAEKLLAIVESGEAVNVIVMVELLNEDPYLMQAGEPDPIRVLGVIDWMKDNWKEFAMYNYDDPSNSG